MKMNKNKIVIEEDPINSLVEIEDTTNYEIKSNDSGKGKKKLIIPKKNKKVIKTIVTPRGYAIVKQHFGFRDINRTKKELTVSPYVNENYAAKAAPFPVYLESDKKLFLPKHYGFETFGDPDKIKDTAKGLDIDLEFAGELRSAQLEPIAAFMKSCEPGSLSSKSKGGIITVGCGGGKCLKKDTKIMMFSGEIRMVQDIKVGDQIMGDDSTPRNVLSLARGREMMYEVIPTKGESYTVNESHILSLKCSCQKSRYPKGSLVDMSVKEYLALPPSYHGKAGPLLGYRVPVIFPEKEVDIEPYALGYWLGDGTSREPAITTIEEPVINYFKEYCDRLNQTLVQGHDTIHSKGSMQYRLSGKKKENNSRTENVFLNMLKSNNLIDNKHIPHKYKCNSRKIQLEVLAGIIDSDGYLHKECYDITQKREDLLDDIIYIARSLGFAAYKTECKKSCIYKGGKREGTYYRTTIHGPGIEEIPVKCPRKQAYGRKQIKDVLATRIRLEKKEVDDYYGFEIDGNHRFLLGDTTVTHNTVMGLYLIGALKKKTLIIVHKEFLINQWKERIEQFLPDARVGVIQSSKVEIRNKDIVIGMLQSISMREYPWETFDDFGFTIVDECFPYKTGIITDHGIKYIGDLYNKWENNEHLPKILSYNQELKIFEYKNLTYSWRKLREDLIKITMSNKTITCTPEHKILTINGYKEAKKLHIGDIILSKYDVNNKNSTIAKSLNYDQLQIIYGTYLGCGKIKYTKKYRTKMEIIHPEKQKDYCYWKGEILGVKKFNYIKGNEYQENSHRFTTDIFDFKEEFLNKNISVPQWLVDKLELMGIAIWYMDKGKLIDSKVSLHGRFDHESFLRLIKVFNSYGLYPTLKGLSKTNLYIKFNIEDSNELLLLLNKYLHHSFRNCDVSESIVWNNKFLEYGTLVINKLEYIKNKGHRGSTVPFVYDIEIEDNHNFVIGEKPKKNQIQYFDGPVVSNCHHIGAEVFSRALPKINSQYSLGLSATPKRKDGLSKVFHWFLGPTLFDNKKREGLLPIHVNIAMYNSSDQKYSKMEVTGFGKICMARMVNNICDYERRTELVLEILKKLYNNGKKVLILSDRRAHLKEIFEKVESRNIATIGYYVGGMKEKELKKSEGKEILLGTYTMSSEGMDIPDLDAVIFASPRSDIIQSIGRILRKKHESNPICWDIVDNFSVFPNQYTKRRAYYRKMDYPINIYDFNDDQNEPIIYLTDQLNNTPKQDIKGEKKKKKSESQENIIVNDYGFIEEEE